MKMKKRIPISERIPFPFYHGSDPYTDDQIRSLFYESPDPEDDPFLFDFDGIVNRYLQDPFFESYRTDPVKLIRDHIDKTISAYTCPTWGNYPDASKPVRMYPYKVTLYMYNGMREYHYIHARNERDAFDKAHRFANPIAMSGKYGGVQFIVPKRLTKQYCIDNKIIFEGGN